MDFNDLLVRQRYDPKTTLVLRHRPFEPALNRALPWLAAERPDLFRAFQQCQGAQLANTMLKATHIASFIGAAPRQALFEAIHKTSALTAAMPHWTEIDLTWSDLAVLPARWRAALAEWRGIYLIFDSADGKSYVGSAYGTENLLGRWQSYAASGHGGNRHLRTRAPETFRFSILERLGPDTTPEAVIAVEARWKRRLHTAWPQGLNDN